MDMTIFEDDIKYSPWAKAALALAPLLLAVLGMLFFLNARGSSIFPKESAPGSQTASIVLFGSAWFVLVVYWFAFPRKISVHPWGIKIKHGGFGWHIPFESIKTILPSKGVFVWWGYSSLTSYAHQIEIVKTSGFKVRVCPSRRDEFLAQANSALQDWTRAHPSSEQ